MRAVSCNFKGPGRIRGLSGVLPFNPEGPDFPHRTNRNSWQQPPLSGGNDAVNSYGKTLLGGLTIFE